MNAFMYATKGVKFDIVYVLILYYCWTPNTCLRSRNCKILKASYFYESFGMTDMLRNMVQTKTLNHYNHTFLLKRLYDLTFNADFKTTMSPGGCNQGSPST